MTTDGRVSSNSGLERFWSLAAPLLELENVERSTMMGYHCLRRSGRYFASIDREGTGLIAELFRARVEALIAEGTGAPFSPAGRVFLEWVFLALERVDAWSSLMAEAYAFAAAR
jgi:hypothetical protein